MACRRTPRPDELEERLRSRDVIREQLEHTGGDDGPPVDKRDETLPELRRPRSAEPEEDQR